MERVTAAEERRPFGDKQCGIRCAIPQIAGLPRLEESLVRVVPIPHHVLDVLEADLLILDVLLKTGLYEDDLQRLEEVSQILIERADDWLLAVDLNRQSQRQNKCR